MRDLATRVGRWFNDGLWQRPPVILDGFGAILKDSTGHLLSSASNASWSQDRIHRQQDRVFSAHDMGLVDAFSYNKYFVTLLGNNQYVTCWNLLAKRGILNLLLPAGQTMSALNSVEPFGTRSNELRDVLKAGHVLNLESNVTPWYITAAVRTRERVKGLPVWTLRKLHK